VLSCDGDYLRLKDCLEFNQLAITERSELVNLFGLCRKCLMMRHGPYVKICPNKDEPGKLSA
jgi:hypothetical protein